MVGICSAHHANYNGEAGFVILFLQKALSFRHIAPPDLACVYQQGLMRISASTQPELWRIFQFIGCDDDQTAILSTEEADAARCIVEKGFLKYWHNGGGGARENSNDRGSLRTIIQS